MKMDNTSCMVFWAKTDETSILKNSETRAKSGRKRGGEVYQAKWHGKWYDVRILAGE